MTAVRNRAPQETTTASTLVLCVHFHGNLFIRLPVASSRQAAWRGRLLLINRCCLRPIKSFVVRFQLSSFFPKVEMYLYVPSPAASWNCLVEVTGAQRRNHLCTFFFPSWWANALLTKGRRAERKRGFVVSPSSGRSCRMKHNGALFIGHSDKLLFFRSKRKNRFRAKVTPSPSNHPPVYSVISISVWRVLFALDSTSITTTTAKVWTARPQVCLHRCPQTVHNIQVQFVYFLFSQHTRLLESILKM